MIARADRNPGSRASTTWSARSRLIEIVTGVGASSGTPSTLNEAPFGSVAIDSAAGLHQVASTSSGTNAKWTIAAAAISSTARVAIPPRKPPDDFSWIRTVWCNSRLALYESGRAFVVPPPPTASTRPDGRLTPYEGVRNIGPRDPGDESGAMPRIGRDGDAATDCGGIGGTPSGGVDANGRDEPVGARPGIAAPGTRREPAPPTFTPAGGVRRASRLPVGGVAGGNTGSGRGARIPVAGVRRISAP